MHPFSPFRMRFVPFLPSSSSFKKPENGRRPFQSLLRVEGGTTTAHQRENAKKKIPSWRRHSGRRAGGRKELKPPRIPFLLPGGGGGYLSLAFSVSFLFSPSLFFFPDCCLTAASAKQHPERQSGIPHQFCKRGSTLSLHSPLPQIRHPRLLCRATANIAFSAQNDVCSCTPCAAVRRAAAVSSHNDHFDTSRPRMDGQTLPLRGFPLFSLLEERICCCVFCHARNARGS